MQSKSTGPGWNPQASASFWINRASRSLLRLQDGRLRPHGFGMSQMPVLHALEDGRALSQKALADWARVEQPTMAVMLSRMERDGVISREPDPSDGRGTLVSLTKKSRERLSKGRAALLEADEDATAGLTAAEKKTLIGLLERVVKNLER